MTRHIPNLALFREQVGRYPAIALVATIGVMFLAGCQGAAPALSASQENPLPSPAPAPQLDVDTNGQQEDEPQPLTAPTAIGLTQKLSPGEFEWQAEPLARWAELLTR